LGYLVIQNSFSEGRAFKEGLAAVNYNRDGIDNWSFVNVKGELTVMPMFDSVEDFKNGLAKVWYQGQLGYINKSGFYVWKPTY